MSQGIGRQQIGILSIIFRRCSQNEPRLVLNIVDEYDGDWSTNVYHSINAMVARGLITLSLQPYAWRGKTVSITVDGVYELQRSIRRYKPDNDAKLDFAGYLERMKTDGESGETEG